MCAEEHDHHADLHTPGDPGVAQVARRQHGVISRAQLEGLGIDRGAIAWRLRRGRLHSVHRGVYAVGHSRLTFHGRLWAAVLACGGVRAGVLSHRSAAAVWELLPVAAGRVDVTTLRTCHSTAAIRVHRSRTLDPLDDVVHRDGLPLTTPMRTLVDLQDVATPGQLDRATHQAERLRLLDTAKLTTAVPGRHSRRLRSTLDDLARTGPILIRSTLERRFLELVADVGLPRPLVNTRVLGIEVDFFWPAQRLIVETDGRETHLTVHAFEEDRRRDAALQAAGFRVVRFTWRRVLSEPGAVAATLESLLTLESGPPWWGSRAVKGDGL